MGTKVKDAMGSPWSKRSGTRNDRKAEESKTELLHDDELNDRQPDS
jgi:hypothetical protein